MSNIPPTDFSFDLYPGLDGDLEAAYERNVALGTASPEDVATGGLAAAVQSVLTPHNPERLQLQEVEDWARGEIDRAGVLWSAYRDILGVEVPTSLEDLRESYPSDFEETIRHLYKAKQALTESGGVTPEGLNIGDTMHIVLMPWEVIGDTRRSGNFKNWINRMRNAQDIFVDEYINADLLTAVRENRDLYRDINEPSEMHTPTGYLARKIEQDGPWGLVLMQTSNQAGLERFVSGPPENRTPDALTNNGNDHLYISGYDVDAMGIFEWLALTFQEDPHNLSSQDYSWMLANRLEVSGGPRVPYGDWYVGRVWSYLNSADAQYDDVRPRLAVM